jgi:endonuclease YncB( thermonuclease family)
MAVLMASVGLLVITGQKPPEEAEMFELSAGTYAGFPKVESASLLRFGDSPVRLKGIHAPDTDQTCITRAEIEWHCGQTAAGVLREFVANGPVTCDGIVDDWGRTIVAACHDSSGRSISAQLVESGWAVVDRNGSSDYIDLEDHARREGLGLWSSRFEIPRE